MPFIKDAIHSYMAIPEYFEPLIDSLPVQRLRRIRQLAGTEYVYPGATHTRFEHSLGVMYLAGRLCDILNENSHREGNGTVVNEHYKKAIMSSALLHDIGHGPFSHVFEKLYEDKKKNHEDISRWLIKTYLVPVLEKMDQDPDEISKLATGMEVDKDRMFMSQIIAGTIDCDSLDYFVRDSYYTGALVGTLDVSRILLMTRVVGSDLAFDLKIGLPILEGYFLVRLNSFKQIYFHKTSRASQIMIYNALENRKEEFNLGVFNTHHDFLKWDDYTLWSAIQDDYYIKRLKRRDMVKMVFEKSDLHDSRYETKLEGSQITRLEEEIAADAGIDPKNVFIDVPYMKTVPYAHATTFDPEDIPVYINEKNIIKKLSELSVLFSLLKGYYNIIRVYTWKEHRKDVSRASMKVLGN
ncbi:MAG: HD domain-containing protein [Promethearchaeota archaeon]